MPPRLLPRFRLTAEPASEQARAVAGFAWAPPEVGDRHALGGEPTWLQGDVTPTCPDCGELMTFYGQLDSVGDDATIADCGLIYVFVCFDDFAARAIVQSL